MYTAKSLDGPPGTQPSTFAAVTGGLPFSSRISPLTDTVGEQSRRWAITMGLAGDDGGERLVGLVAHVAACRMYPMASLARLTLITDFLTWLFSLDDHLDLGKLPNETERTTLAHLTELLHPSPRPRPATGEPLIDAFNDLRHRMSSLASPEWVIRFSAHLGEVFTSFRKEAAYRLAGVTPSVDDYVQNRRHTSCGWVFADLAELVNGPELSPALRSSAEYLTWVRCVTDIAAWDNDIVSLPRELASGEVNNLVLVIVQAHNLSREQATGEVTRRIHRRCQAYLYAEDRMLAYVHAVGMRRGAFLRHHRLILSFRDMLSGVITWNHTDTKRFS